MGLKILQLSADQHGGESKQTKVGRIFLFQPGLVATSIQGSREVVALLLVDNQKLNPASYM